MMTAGDRLRISRQRAGYTSARAAALDLGVPVSTYNSHERAGDPEARDFDLDKARLYGRRFRVDPIWLLTGDGDASLGVPLISWVSAGALEATTDIETGPDVHRLREPDLPAGDWIALRVTGDSMNLISPDGSIIFVNRSERRLVSNSCYVIADGESGEATFKRYRPSPMRFEPVSSNPDHETLFPERPPKVIGRVRRSLIDL